MPQTFYDLTGDDIDNLDSTSNTVQMQQYFRDRAPPASQSATTLHLYVAKLSEQLGGFGSFPW